MQKPRTGSDLAIYTVAGLVASYALFAVVTFIDGKCFDSRGFSALPEPMQMAVGRAYSPVAHILFWLGV